MPTNPVLRDGFSYEFDKFLATPHDLERVSCSHLRAAFLPDVTAQGKIYLRRGGEGDFVRSQLKHYGVAFDESELVGDGVQLLKDALEAGKCYEVPPHVTKLRDQMHTEWIAQLTPKEFARHPNLAMERYFLTDGQPDPAKTTTVIGIPFDEEDCYASMNLHFAVEKVKGLHASKSQGYKTETVFVGWDRTAVIEAAKQYRAEQKKIAAAAKEKRDAKRSVAHDDYLKTLEKRKGTDPFSPVGTYIVDCNEIEYQWPEDAENLHLSIRATKETGIFKVTFDFGILEGIMMIGPDKSTVKKYCCQLDRRAGKGNTWVESEDDSESDDEDDDEDEDEDEDEKEDGEGKKDIINDENAKDEGEAESGRKRVAPTTKGKDEAPPPKKAKPEAPRPNTYFLQMRCAETQEHAVYSVPKYGSLTYQDDTLASFAAEATIPCVGSGIPFTARKISDKVSGRGKAWSAYVDDSYGTVWVEA